MLQVVVNGGTIYKDIVEEDDDELTEIWPENGIHGGLK